MEFTECLSAFEDFLRTKETFQCSCEEMVAVLQTISRDEKVWDVVRETIMNTPSPMFKVDGQTVSLSSCYLDSIKQIEDVLQEDKSGKLSHIMQQIRKSLGHTQRKTIGEISTMLDISGEEKVSVKVCEQRQHLCKAKVKMHHYLLLEGLQDVVASLLNNENSLVEDVWKSCKASAAPLAMQKVGMNHSKFEKTLNSYPEVFQVEDGKVFLNDSPRITHSLILSHMQSAKEKLKDYLLNQGPLLKKELFRSSSQLLTRAEVLAMGGGLEAFTFTLLSLHNDFLVIPPHMLVIAQGISQVQDNPFVSAIAKIKDYIRSEGAGDGSFLSQLVTFVNQKLDPCEQAAVGNTSSKIRETVVAYPDHFGIEHDTVFIRSDAAILLEGTSLRIQSLHVTKVNQRTMADHPSSDQSTEYSEDSAYSDALDDPVSHSADDGGSSVRMLSLGQDEVESLGSESISDSESLHSGSTGEVECFHPNTALLDEGTVTILQDIKYFGGLITEFLDKATIPTLSVSLSEGWLIVGLWDGHTFAISLDLSWCHQKIQGQSDASALDFLTNKSILKVVFGEKLCDEINDALGIKMVNVFDLMMAYNLIRPELNEAKTLLEALTLIGVDPYATVEVCNGTIQAPLSGEAYTEEAIIKLKEAARWTMKQVPYLYQKILGMMTSSQITKVSRLHTGEEDHPITASCKEEPSCSIITSTKTGTEEVISGTSSRNSCEEHISGNQSNARSEEYTTVTSTSAKACSEEPISGRPSMTSSEQPICGIPLPVSPEVPVSSTISNGSSVESISITSTSAISGIPSKTSSEEPISGAPSKASWEEPVSGTPSMTNSEESIAVTSTSSKPSPKEPISGIQSKKSSAEPISGIPSKTSSEEPKCGTPSNTSSEEPISTTQSKTSSKDPDSSTLSQTSSEQPKSGASSKASSEKPGSGNPSKNSCEKPVSVTSSTINFKKPDSVKSSKTSFKELVSVTSSEISLEISVSGKSSSSEKPDSGTSSKISSEKPDPDTSSKTSSQKRGTGKSSKTSSEKPDSCTLSKISTEKPDPGTSSKTSSQKHETGKSSKTSSEKPVSVTSSKSSSGRPESGTSSKASSKISGSAKSSKANAEKPDSGKSSKSSSQKSDSPKTSSQKPDSDKSSKTSSEKPLSVTSSKTSSKKPVSNVSTDSSEKPVSVHRVSSTSGDVEQPDSSTQAHFNHDPFESEEKNQPALHSSAEMDSTLKDGGSISRRKSKQAQTSKKTDKSTQQGAEGSLGSTTSDTTSEQWTSEQDSAMANAKVIHYDDAGKPTLIPFTSKLANKAINPCLISHELSKEFSKIVMHDQDKFLEAFGICIKYNMKKLSEEHKSLALDQLTEVVMDVGRKPSARYYQREHPGQLKVRAIGDKPLTKQDLKDFMEGHCSPVSSDHRSSIKGTLHRVGIMCNRQNETIGLTALTKHAVLGCATPLFDLMNQGQSILVVGNPGVGKSTILREAARVINDVVMRRVVIVDTCNEIAGDGDIPHPSVGGARRVQLLDRDAQPSMIREVVRNHSPQTLIIDEVMTEADAAAVLGTRQRGIQVISTAPGQTLQDVILNPNLVHISGRIQNMAVNTSRGGRGDNAGVPLPLMRRTQPAAFDILVEMHDRYRWIVHTDFTCSIDMCLQKESVSVQERRVVMKEVSKDSEGIPEVMVQDLVVLYPL